MTQVAVLRNGVSAGTAPVVNGQIDTAVQLEEGVNRFTISATIDDTEVQSDEVVLTRWEGPLADRWFAIAVSGSANTFAIEVIETSASRDLSASRIPRTNPFLPRR